MPDTEGPDKIVLDAASFNSAERLECQTHFDAPFGDLMRCINEAIDPNRTVAQSIRIVDRDDVQHFPDQIIQFMVWVQTKRTRPDATVDEFDGLEYRDLSSAHVRGLLGKASTGKPTKQARPGGKRKKSSTGSSSAGESQE